MNPTHLKYRQYLNPTHLKYRQYIMKFNNFMSIILTIMNKNQNLKWCHQNIFWGWGLGCAIAKHFKNKFRIWFEFYSSRFCIFTFKNMIINLTRSKHLSNDSSIQWQFLFEKCCTFTLFFMSTNIIYLDQNSIIHH